MSRSHPDCSLVNIYTDIYAMRHQARISFVTAAGTSMAGSGCNIVIATVHFVVVEELRAGTDPLSVIQGMPSRSAYAMFGTRVRVQVISRTGHGSLKGRLVRILSGCGHWDEVDVIPRVAVWLRVHDGTAFA